MAAEDGDILGFADPDDYRAARDVLRRGRYDYDAVCETLGDADWVSLRAMDLPRYDRRVREPSVHNTLIRLFLLAGSAPADHVRQALEPMTPAQWVAAKLLPPPSADRPVRGTVRLTPLEDLVLAADCPLLGTSHVPADEYAMAWVTSTESQDPAAVPRLFGEWMDYYEREGIEQIRYLLVTLRRRDASANWTYVDDETVAVAAECGEAIRGRFALLDYLAALPGDEALLDEHLVLAPEARLLQEHVMTAEGPKVAHNRLEMRGGLRRTAELDVNVVRLLVYCDPQRPLWALLAGMAEGLGVAPDGVVRIALPVVRRLIECGFLKPASPADRLPR